VTAGAKYLLDTNIFSERLKPTPDTGVIAKLDAAAGLVAIASVVWHELLYGVERLPVGKRRSYMSGFLTEVVRPSCEFADYDEAASRWHAMERCRLESAGFTPAFPDGQIAAIAATRGLILVTRNVTDFARFNGLTIENWFPPAP
jgi:tRNA(fMet)-specific endonuclease VapC